MRSVSASAGPAAPGVTLVRPPIRDVRSRYFDSARWAGYRPRWDDIVISTFPKCGTTWTQRIVSMLLAGGAEAAPVFGPWFDTRLSGPVGPTLEQSDAIVGRRYLKSHLPFDALPVYDSVKFIHTARDGRDSAMSWHNHVLGYTPATVENLDQVSLADPKFGDRMAPMPEDPAEAFRQWLVDGGALGDPGCSYWHLERSYWAARRDANMLLVHYNDLKTDLAGEVGRIAGYLEIELPASVMGEIVSAAGFEAMRGQGEALLPDAEKLWVRGAKTFLNKGVNGRWQGACAEEDLATYRAKVTDEFTPGLAAWLEGGRLAAGDPALSSD